MRGPAYYSEGIPVFVGENYFDPGNNFFIQFADENRDYIGIPHKHTFIELTLIISGKAYHEIQGKRYRVQRGDLVIINYSCTHAFYPIKDEEDFNAYDLMFMPDFFNVNGISGNLNEILSASFLFYSFPRNDFSGDDTCFSNHSFSEIKGLFDRMYKEYYGHQKGYYALIRAYLIELLVMLSREKEFSASSGNTARQMRIVYEVVDYLNRNYLNPISIQELADKYYFSKEYLARLFKAITGETMTNMLQQIRINAACQMLVSTDRIVSDICVSCGFHDAKFFYTKFKRITGMTPGEYRRKKRKDELSAHLHGARER